MGLKRTVILYDYTSLLWYDTQEREQEKDIEKKMAEKINFFTNGSWRGGAPIPPRMRNVDKLASWLKRFVTEIKEVKERYKDSVIRDGKLVGQEKANIVMELDDLLGGLFLLRQNLTEGNPQKLTSLDVHQSFEYTVELRNNNWFGEGKHPAPSKDFKQGFRNWYNKVFLTQSESFISVLGSALTKNEFSEQNRVEVLTELERLVFSIIQMEEQLLTAEQTQ
ncbi:MAG: hypothetical protein ACLFR1_09470 [Spirochaetia bacterium]